MSIVPPISIYTYELHSYRRPFLSDGGPQRSNLLSCAQRHLPLPDLLIRRGCRPDRPPHPDHWFPLFSAENCANDACVSSTQHRLLCSSRGFAGNRSDVRAVRGVRGLADIRTANSRAIHSFADLFRSGAPVFPLDCKSYLVSAVPGAPCAGKRVYDGEGHE